MNRTIQLMGWCGVLLVLLGYFLVSERLVSAETICYQVINACGALFVAIEAKTKNDSQPFWLNVIWLCVALLSIARILTAW